MYRLLTAVALILLCAQSAYAAEAKDVETDFPLTIEDASATDKGEVDLRFMSRWEHTDDQEERFTVQPEIEAGIAENTELNLTLPFYPGGADDDHGGDLGVEVLYNFLQEQEAAPALAISGNVDLPTGDNSQGLDTTLRLLGTKHIFKQCGEHALHANLSWMHNAAAQSDEREDAYRAVIGSSHGLTDKTALVTDFVREQEDEAGENSNIIELGLRHEFAKDSIASIGAGAGIGEESPDFRMTFGVQHTF